MKLSKNSLLIWTAAILGVVIIAVGGVAVYSYMSGSNEAEELRQQNEELMLQNEQLRLAGELDAVGAEFARYEDQAQRLTNDTIYAKYTAAKQRVQQLQQEIKKLNTTNSDNRARIAKLEGEISTLRGLLRHYIEQIDSLSRENAGLRAENQEMRTRNEALSSQVQEVSARNSVLNERMTLAEKLNVTGVSLAALKSNGKSEKNITKARQLCVTFTIPQNNSTPVGSKTIYLRLTNPEGQLLGNGGSMSFEGGSVACTARKNIEYSGDEISGIRIYWDVNTTLTPGDYTVELFTDGYRLASRHFTMKK